MITQKELHKARTLSGRTSRSAEIALSRWRVMGADAAETVMKERVGSLKHDSLEDRRQLALALTPAPTTSQSLTLTLTLTLTLSRGLTRTLTLP